MRQAGLFGLSEHLKRLSAYGDPLEQLGRIIDFEAFRPTLTAALAYGAGAKGGRPPYDPVAMLKVLILAAQNNVADARMEYLIRDRLSWLRFLGFDLGAPTPDANTIRLFREKLTEAGALDAVFTDFDRRVARRMSFTTASAGRLAGDFDLERLGLIFVPSSLRRDPISP
jgi:IS5 family transposase